MEEELNTIVDEQNTEEEQLDKLFHSAFEEYIHYLKEIYELFIEEFTEENVDMQDVIDYDIFKGDLENALFGDILSYNDCNPEECDPILQTTREHNRITPFKELPMNIRLLVLQRLHTRDRSIRYFECERYAHPKIIVHFPHIKITNEHNNSTIINHLWVKVHVSYRGRIIENFKMNRSEYTLLHFASHYMHSHVPSLHYEHITDWKDPCLGSGPIRETIKSLRDAYSKELWTLFCYELSQYVTVESLEGIPYITLEKLHFTDTIIGAHGYLTYLGMPYTNDTITESQWVDFIKHLLHSNKLKFSYINNAYAIGMPMPEYFSVVSDEFIKWCNEKLKTDVQKNPSEWNISLYNLTEAHKILIPCVIINGRIYKKCECTSRDFLNRYIGQEVLIFHGIPITINITETAELDNSSTCYLLEERIALSLLHKILTVLNYKKCINNNNYDEDKTSIFYKRLSDISGFQQDKTKVRYY